MQDKYDWRLDNPPSYEEKEKNNEKMMENFKKPFWDKKIVKI